MTVLQMNYGNGLLSLGCDKIKYASSQKLKRHNLIGEYNVNQFFFLFQKSAHIEIRITGICSEKKKICYRTKTNVLCVFFTVCISHFHNKNLFIVRI